MGEAEPLARRAWEEPCFVKDSPPEQLAVLTSSCSASQDGYSGMKISCETSARCVVPGNRILFEQSGASVSAFLPMLFAS